jgi:hypothetical protein
LYFAVDAKQLFFFHANKKGDLKRRKVWIDQNQPRPRCTQRSMLVALNLNRITLALNAQSPVAACWDRSAFGRIIVVTDMTAFLCRNGFFVTIVLFIVVLQ